MRTIKFRGWGIHVKHWIFGDFSGSYPNDGASIQYYDEEDGWMCDDVKEKTVGQFTGAFDCEGREIYEGDILSACYGHAPNIIEVKGVVEFVHSGFALRFGEDAGVWLDQLIHAEIIGNIHDNPELLKGGEE